MLLSSSIRVETTTALSGLTKLKPDLVHYEISLETVCLGLTYVINENSLTGAVEVDPSV
jgi:hypothetical protein